MRPIRLLLGVALFLIAGLIVQAPSHASAAEFRSGGTPEITASETIKDDLYITGGKVIIAGHVTGDVIAAAGEIHVTGQIDGDLQLLSGTVTMDGVVAGSLRAAAGDVKIAGAVGRDVLLASGTLSVQSRGSIGGDVVAAGGDVEILGPVKGNVTGNVGSLTINSRVGGDVDVTADNVHLLSKARTAGDLRYSSRNEASIASGATVSGAKIRSTPDRFYPGDNIAAWLGSGLFRIFCGLIAGLVVIVLMPRAVASVADAARLAPLTSLLFGVILTVLLPALFVVLLVTVVGAPIAVIGLAVYFSVLYLSQVFLGLAIGRIILPSSWDTAGRGYNLLAMTIGVLILGGLRLIPLPFVSVAIATVTAAVGLGAFAVAMRTARRPLKLPAY